MKIKKIVGLVVLLTLGVVSVSFASIDKNLKYGQRDKEVAELQEFLISKGLLKTNISNFFGVQTFNAVKAYQLSLGVVPTGFIGVQTRERINKELNIFKASTTAQNIAKNNINNSVITTKTTTSTTSIDINIPDANSIYDSNTKIDKLGRKVTITQIPNYKSSSYVRASIDISSSTINGLFDKNTKTFATEAELDALAKQTQIEVDKRNAINLSTVVQETVKLPVFDFTEEIVARHGGIYDSNRAKHTVICAYGNSDAGIKDYQIKIELKKLLDKAPIFASVSDANNVTVNVTKTIDPTIYDEPNMVYTRLTVCGVITNKNGQKDYLFSGNYNN